MSSKQSSSKHSQWDCIRQNIGTWHGSFVQFSPTGKQLKDTPSVLTLEETAVDQTMTLTLKRFPADEAEKVNQLTFTAPGPAPYVYFFEDGSFAQGSAQWSSFGQFGTEVSLKVGDRRVRYVIMYQGTSHYTSQIDYVTLICETQTDGTQLTESTLTAEQLLGQWTGTVEAIQSTGEMTTAGRSAWQFSNGTALFCEEQFGSSHHTLFVENTLQDTLASENVIQLSSVKDEPLDYQLMLLPNGAYCLLPKEIKQNAAFRIEAGWLSSQGIRHRFIRHYDSRGVWVDSTLVSDQKITD